MGGAMLGTPMSELVLSEEERELLERWARQPRSAQDLALRCRIVLLCAEGLENTAVARQLGVNRMTVGKWRSRFVDQRIDGLHDEPRPGAPRRIGDDAIEAVIVKTLEATPTDATHWSSGHLKRKSLKPKLGACAQHSCGFGFAEPEAEVVLGPDALRLERLLAPASISLMRTDRHIGDAPDDPARWDIGAGTPGDAFAHDVVGYSAQVYTATLRPKLFSRAVRSKAQK
jgi:Homeodomain-like domain